MADIQQIEELFSAARARPREERSDFLLRHCGHDESLRARLEEMLNLASDAPPDLFDPPEITLLPGDLHQFLDDGKEDEALPTLQHYRIVRPLGDGGMGKIFLAEQLVPLQRMVAIKIMRQELGGRHARARFALEQRALSVMEHPSIARIFDAGLTDESQPYLAMEYIDGVPITKYCVEARLPLRARFELFIQVCDAIHHAHQKGIIHRDIKPSNILVTKQEGEARAKVIDFSIAKPTAGQTAVNQTRHGERLGSLNYISPEQFTGVADVDTRADIYALGALLYELVTDAPALDWHGPCEQLPSGDRFPAPPLAPSARIRQLTPGGDGRRLARRLRGDLDWIVLKALEHERALRYDSAAEFGRDIVRYLNREPVSVGPPSVRYRLRKFVARHRTPVVASGIIVLLLVLSLIGITWQALNAARARRAELDQSYVTAITAAYLAIESHDPGSASRLLAGAPPSHRGWEWHHLDTLVDESESKIDTHEMIMSMVLSPDHRKLIGGTLSGRLESWDANSGEPSITLGRCENKVACVEYAPDRSLLASGQYGGSVCLWDANDGHLLDRFDPQPHTVVSLAFSRGGETLAIASQNGVISIYDLARRTIVQTWQADLTWSIAFAGPDVVATCQQNGIRLWNTRDGSVLHAFDAPERPARLTVDRQCTMLAVGFHADGVHVWDLQTRGRIANLDTDRNDVVALAFSDDGKRLVAGTRDLAVRSWTTKPFQSIEEFRGHTDAITSVAVDTDRGRVFSASKDRTIRVWREGCDDVCRAFGNQIRSASADSDGSCVVVIGQDHVYQWLPGKGCQPSILASATQDADFAATAPDGHQVALAAQNGLLLCDLQSGELRELGRSPDTVFGLRYSPDGKTLAVVSGTTIQLRSASSGENLATLAGHTGTVRAVAFAHDRPIMCSIGDDRCVRIWNTQVGECRAKFECLGFLKAVACDSKGTIVAAAERDGSRVTLWDVTHESVLGHIDIAGTGATALAFSPDADRIFIGTESGAIQVWRVATRDIILNMTGSHEAWIVSLDVARDGRLTSTSWDGTARTWDVHR